MKEIKVGIVGLGRLGSVHAQNLAFKIPGCKLVAACSLEQKELDWAKDYLKVEYTTTDYKKMVDEADIEAVVIVSSSPEHCWITSISTSVSGISTLACSFLQSSFRKFRYCSRPVA